MLQCPRQWQSRDGRLQRDRSAKFAVVVDDRDGNADEPGHVLLVVDPNAFRVGPIQLLLQQVHIGNRIVGATLEHEILEQRAPLVRRILAQQ